MDELNSVLQVDPRPIDVLDISETFLTPSGHGARLAIHGFHGIVKGNVMEDCWHVYLVGFIYRPHMEQIEKLYRTLKIFYV